MALERLQKIIAAAGIASRRKAEELIQQGLVSVNGTTVTELGSKADPETDSIRVNDKPIKGPERHEYIALNKPRGYVTTVSDPEGRPTVMQLVRSKGRVYPIGRLDYNSEGLLLLTNDGDLAHKLMKAASNIPKTYLVKVAGQPQEEQLRRLRGGVSIAEERNPGRRVRTAPAQIRVIKEADNPWLEVTLHEGRNRQIRKMFEEIGHHVEKIRRVRYGPLELDLPPGESRMLNAKELAQLQHALKPQAQSDFKTREARPSFVPKRENFRPDRGERRGNRERPDRQDRPGFAAPEDGAKTENPPPKRFDRDRDKKTESKRPFRPRRDDASEGRSREERRPNFGARSERGERSSRPSRFGPKREGRGRQEGRGPGRDTDKKTESKRPFRPRRDDASEGRSREERRPNFSARSERGERSSRPSRFGPKRNSRSGPDGSRGRGRNRPSGR